MSMFLLKPDTRGGQFICCHLFPSRSQSIIPAPMPGIALISYVSTHPNVAAGQGKQGGQWAEFLWGLVIGLQLSLASYVFGEQCALIVDRYLVPGGRDDTDLEGIEDRCARSLAIWLRMLCRAFHLNNPALCCWMHADLHHARVPGSCQAPPDKNSCRLRGL